MRIAKIVAPVIGVLLFAAPALAQTTDVQSQIASLLAQIKQLQALIAQLQGQGGIATASCVNLQNNLYLDQTDTTTNGEVSKLQQFLGGRVTGYYGPATLQLVQNWQSSRSVVSSGDPDTTGFGYVGPKTRVAMSCSGAQTTSTSNTYVPPTTTYVPPTNPQTTPNTTTTTQAAPITYANEVALARHRQQVVPLASCGNGNDFQDGGTEFDTLIYSGKRSEFYVTKYPDGSYTFKDLVSCRADTDTVINVEQFVFGDGVRTLDTLYPDRVETSTYVPQTTQNNEVIPNPSVPTCTLTANKNTAASGDSMVLSWTSKDAVYASWVQDGTANILGFPLNTLSDFGSQMITVAGKGYLTPTLAIFGKGGSGSCSTTIRVQTDPPTANIDSPSNSVSQAPVISGSASSAVLLMIELRNNLGNRVVSDNVSVASNGRWTWVPPIAIQNGVYVINVWSTDGAILVSKTLTVGALANYDACRLDKLDGSNITRDAITDQYTCLAKICDIYGPANLPNNESKCVFNGTEIKRYTKPTLNVTTMQMGNTLAPQNAIVAFTKFTLTNSGTQQITVNGITIEKVGAVGNIVTTASDAVFANVLLRDENNAQIGSSIPLDANHRATLGGSFTVSPGQTRTLTVYGTMAANNSTDNGNVVGLSVTAISTTASVNGSLPISGARDTVNTSLQCSDPVYGYECAN